MSPRPLEEQLLAAAHGVLKPLSAVARLEVLEAAASRLGGFSLEAFRRRFEPTEEMSPQKALEVAAKVVDAIGSTRIQPSLALCALARPVLSESEQRSSGAYYTDFRLAHQVVAAASPFLVPGARIIDPASGTGILLVAATLAACGQDRLRRSKWLAESVTAWDLSARGLRGARLALASLTDDLGAVERMVARWRCHDSLLAERSSWGKFDVVLGNPPWEKVKLTRHEFVKASGGERHYGADYGQLDLTRFASEREGVARYASTLTERYALLGGGEPDLYKAFLELFLGLARPDGCVSVLVPAGLIRSQGTEDLRRFLFDNADDLAFTILDNRARFFAIDTRFKFLNLVLTKARSEKRRGDVRILHATGTEDGVAETGRARVSRRALASIRPDLTVPEVRSEGEWRLFHAMSENAVVAKGSQWEAEIVREVDMTRDRRHFVAASRGDRLPLIEGRMVHQHRFGAKAYRSGTGRSARWDTVPIGFKALTPQFRFPRAALAASVLERSESLRAGFCDITGQTNERSLLAALVPPGVVCGNKVPTVTFPNDASEARLLLWVAVVNSIPFDWALRRLVTTTVNYFLLNSVPFPKLAPDALPGRRLVEASRELRSFDAGVAPANPWRLAELRASIDVGVLAAYGLGFEDLELMLADFPLLDRGQPALLGEARSTVTRDFLLTHAATRLKARAGLYAERLRRARELGAVPYVPSEFASLAPSDGVEVVDV